MVTSSATVMTVSALTSWDLGEVMSTPATASVASAVTLVSVARRWRARRCSAGRLRSSSRASSPARRWVAAMPGFGRSHTDLSLDEQGDDGEDPDAADPRHGAFGHRAEMAQGGPAGVLGV